MWVLTEQQGDGKPEFSKSLHNLLLLFPAKSQNVPRLGGHQPDIIPNTSITQYDDPPAAACVIFNPSLQNIPGD